MKIGLVGCGAIAGSHLRILKRLMPASQIYLCDAERSKAEQLASRAPVAGMYGSLEDLLDRVQPDAVHILTPPKTHALLAGVALRSHCNVFLEKPVTETLEEYRTIAELARRNNCILCCDFSTLGMPVVMKALEVIRSGSLGRLIAVHCNFAGSEGGGVIPYKSPDHWAYLLKGGILQNMADHPASLIVAAMDPILEQTVSWARRNLLPYDCPDLLEVSVRNADQVGSFILSMGHGCNERSAQFLLEGGSIQIDMGRQLYSCITGRGPQNFLKKAMSGVSEGYSSIGGTIRNVLGGVTGKLQRDPGIATMVKNFYDTLEARSGLMVSPNTVEAIISLGEVIWNEVNYEAAGAAAKEVV